MLKKSHAHSLMVCTVKMSQTSAMLLINCSAAVALTRWYKPHSRGRQASHSLTRPHIMLVWPAATLLLCCTRSFILTRWYKPHGQQPISDHSLCSVSVLEGYQYGPPDPSGSNMCSVVHIVYYHIKLVWPTSDPGSQLVFHLRVGGISVSSSLVSGSGN